MASHTSALSKWSMLLGNLFEHYDAALFSLLSPFLAPLFFPNQDPLTALILSYCMIPLGMIARPLGSLIFGYIGDVYGRKEALILSLLGMAIFTGMMGVLPTYHQIGILAPILLLIGRILQNFFAAGEIMGGAIYLIECSSIESDKNMVSSLYNSSTVAGILLASIAVSIICLFDVVLQCWRILYFLGCFTAIFAFFLRVRIPANTLIVKHQILKLSVKNTFKTYWNKRKILFTIAITSGFYYASYVLPLVMMNGFIPLISRVSQTEMMHLNTFLLVIDFLLLPLVGILANRFSKEKIMMVAGLAPLFFGLPVFLLLEDASFFTVTFIQLLLVIIGVCFSALFHAWIQNLVAPTYRYTFISFSYALGSQVIGGPTAAISLWLFQKTNWPISVGWYWMILGLLSTYLIATQEALAGNLNKHDSKENLSDLIH